VPPLPASDPALGAAELWTSICSRYEPAARQVKAGGRAFTLVAVRDTNTLLDRISPEQFLLDERLPFWADLWPSSVALAEWFLGLGLPARTRVLELGCGVGLAGIAAASAGAAVTMTDYEEDALMFARYNALTNLPFRCASAIRFAHLDWRTPSVTERWDLVCGADILYDRALIDPLLALLARALAPAGTVVLTDPQRSPADDFLAAAGAEGFEIEVRESAVIHEMRPTHVRTCILRRGP
jgi:predicted nicotinamide N-methyase